MSDMDRRCVVKKVNEHVYLLDDAKQATGYLVVGEEKAALIDTLNGLEDLREIVRELTDKEIIVINTHGHCDHIWGNIFFDSAYLHPADLEIAKMMCEMPEFVERSSMFGKQMPEFLPMKEGDAFDLGGLTLKVYECPGHTPGSVLLLLEEDRLLFTGDAINHHLWLQLDGCLPLKDTADAIERVLFLEEKADWILHGHTWAAEDIGLMRGLMKGIREVAEGHISEDVKYDWFGGDNAMMHVYRIEDGRTYLQDHHAVIYRKGQ